MPQLLERQSPEEFFAMRLAEIHGLGSRRHEGRRLKDREMETREAEVRAMFDAFLGAEYDERKIRRVLEIQQQLRGAQPVLFAAYEAGRMAPDAYAREFNAAFKHSMHLIEDVLGRVDFKRLFGCTAEETGDQIDPDEFVTSEAERQAPPRYR